VVLRWLGEWKSLEPVWAKDRGLGEIWEQGVFKFLSSGQRVLPLIVCLKYFKYPTIKHMVDIM
jgi:hypothetical protein